MLFNPPNVPFFYFKEKRFQAKFGTKGTYNHYFGKCDNNELSIINSDTRSYIHQLITLDLNDPYIGLTNLPIKKLPISYPFVLSGANIKYKIINEHTVSVIDINGTYYNDWPFENYPKHFQYIPFELTEPKKSSKKTSARM